MKNYDILTALIGALTVGAPLAWAESNAPVAIQSAVKPAVAQAAHAQVPSAEDEEKASLEKHTKPILEALELNDPARETKVREVLAAFSPALNTWHKTNDAQLKELWSQFNKARSAQDWTNGDNVMSQIGSVYATFKPQHDKLLAGLATVLTPGQIETVEDVLTVNKVKVTFDAYGQIFHGLTDEQKAFILKNLRAAREEAINAVSMTEKSAFFKRYKDKIEAYLTAPGYNVKQSYADFVAKQKAEAAAKRAATQSATNPASNLPEKK
jgi:hypothetical protein